MFSFLRHLFGGRTAKAVTAPRRRLECEALEDRTVPAIIGSYTGFVSLQNMFMGGGTSFLLRCTPKTWDGHLVTGAQVWVRTKAGAPAVREPYHTLLKLPIDPRGYHVTAFWT